MCATIFLLADQHLFDLYGFHINGFVDNLLLMPGGVDSLGASPATFSVAVVIVTVIFALHGMWRWFAWRRLLPISLKRSSVMVIAAAIMSLVVAEKAVYPIGDVTLDGLVLQQAAAVPLYVPVVARHLLPVLWSLRQLLGTIP